MQKTPRVRFERISKRYPGVQALEAVSFSVAPGCVHAVVGENGAGKSTLMKVLAGAAVADDGIIELDGRAANIGDARRAQALGVAIVYQELSLISDLTVGENVFLGRWPRGRFGLIRFREVHDRAAVLFDSLGVAVPAKRRVGDLSIAQRQMVEIARALSINARVLLLDEPSAVLTPHELAALFTLIKRLAIQGVSILYISHRLDEIFELADFVTVLRDGKHISTRPIAETSRDTLIREMVGRPIEEEFPARAAAPREITLRVEGLSCGSRFQEVTFDVREGEVFALAGLVGSGRSSLGRAVFGAARGTRGSLRVGAALGPFSSPRAAQRAGVAFLPEDRKREGLLLERSTRENISLAHLRDFAAAGVMRLPRERGVARKMIDELRVAPRATEAAVRTLSGGNQQKVMLARWLQRPYRVIILDEPTRGVDVGAKVEIYELINRLAAGGTAVLMITSEFPEAIGMADRIGVMARGRLTGVLDNRNRGVTQEAILRLAVGASPDRVHPILGGMLSREAGKHESTDRELGSTSA